MKDKSSSAIARKYVSSWLLRIAPSRYVRVSLLRLFGAKVDKTVNFGPEVFVHVETRESEFSNLEIGENSYVGPRVFIDLSGEVKIGRDVTVSMNSCILSHQDPGESKRRPLSRAYPKVISPVRICEGAYVGANSVIMPGVTVGRKSVIGAGAVVLHDIPDLVLAAGVPAKVLKTIGDLE